MAFEARTRSADDYRTQSRNSARENLDDAIRWPKTGSVEERLETRHGGDVRHSMRLGRLRSTTTRPLCRSFALMAQLICDALQQGQDRPFRFDVEYVVTDL